MLGIIQIQFCDFIVTENNNFIILEIILVGLSKMLQQN